MVNLEKSFVENMFSVEGKVALVTGGTGALGSCIAKAYGYCGAKVVLTGRKLNAKAEEVLKEFQAEGIECCFIAADPQNEEQVKALVAGTVEKYGRIDILAIAHGYNKAQNILDQSVADWQTIIDADLKSVYVVLKYVAEQMVAQVGDQAGSIASGQGGKIVVATSQRSKRGMAGYTGYCASKGGADMMIASMACDLSAKYGINVNSILPTVFRSELTEWMFDPSTEVYKNFMRREPIGRLAEPNDFVGMVLYLSSNASNFMTGGNYDCSGGYLNC